MRQAYSTQLAVAVGILLAVLTVFFALFQSPHVYAPERGYFGGNEVPHPIKGWEQCNRCHGPEGSVPYPENHRGWKDTSCLYCHEPRAPE